MSKRKTEVTVSCHHGGINISCETHDLKKLNTFVKNSHFKIESFYTKIDDSSNFGLLGYCFPRMLYRQ